MKVLSRSMTNDQLEDCKRYCIQLKVSDINNTSLFNPHEIAEIKHCSKIEELFEIVTNKWSWDNYSILTDFIEFCSSTEADKEIKKFERKLAMYKGLKFIFDTPEMNPPSDYERFYVHIEKRYSEFTMEDYKDVKFHIFQLFAINYNVASGHIKALFASLHLEWYVTPQAIPHMMQMGIKEKDNLSTMNIIQINIGPWTIHSDFEKV